MKVSIIIPVLNEEENLKEFIPKILKYGNDDLVEIIVVDGGSQDRSREIAKSFGSRVFASSVKNRAAQMNMGAKNALGEILYFIHADTRIRPEFIEDIKREVSNGNDAGCYRYQFDSPKILLKVNAWFTKFNGLLAGGGDQTLFIKREVFEALGGFDESFCIMEDFELVNRIRKKYKFCIIPKCILVSARKYESNTWLKVQIANLTVFALFFMKKDPQKLKMIYHSILVYR